MKAVGTDVTAFGVMKALSERGEECIQILGLNQRDQLVTARQTAAREIKSLWGELGAVETREKAKASLRQILQGSNQCTLAARVMFRGLKKAADEAAPDS